MKKNVKYVGGLTKEEITALKKKHNTHKVFELQVPVNDEETEIAIGYLKKPSIATIEASMAVWQKHPVRGADIVLQNSWLDGDERIKNAYTNDDSEVMLSVYEQIDGILKVRNGSLKKI